jgi:hypothetical protein
MAIAPLTGSSSSSAKISDLSALITAINTELAALEAKFLPLATKASVDELKARVAVLEAKVIPPDLTARVTALETEPDPVLPPDLTGRVAALEAAVASFRTPPGVPTVLEQIVSPPSPHHRDPSKGVELIYDKATLYYGDMELHAVRIGENTWRLLAQLNFVTVSQVLWTYDETVSGTPEEVYRHAARRLEEIAGLKANHDAAHERVRDMSEGRP